ncbi:MAG: DUF362 domain-containing protein [Candidatus Heimdallarchaeota archaeon]
MKKTKVSIVKGGKTPNEEAINSMVRRAIKLLGRLQSLVSLQDVVLIKPNLVVPREPCSGVTTDPLICKSLADMVREVGGVSIIAESSAFGEDTEEAFEVAGYNQLRNQGYEVIDLKKAGTTKVNVPVPKGKAFKEIYLPKIIMEADLIISVPKMKTHDQTSVTLALKNLKGVISDVYKRKFHTTLGVFQGVADLCTVVRPGLAVVDGIIGQKGLGPIYGTPIERNLIIAGTDPVAVDTITSIVMGFPPEENELIQKAVEHEIGTMNLDEIEVVGERIQDVQFRFKRAEEAVQEVINYPEGFKLVFSEKACTGCRNTIYSVLFDMNAEGTLDKARGLQVVVGTTNSIPIIEKERLLLVGKCTSRFEKYGRYVPGCPPNNKDVKIEIRGHMTEFNQKKFSNKE